MIHHISKASLLVVSIPRSVSHNGHTLPLQPYSKCINWQVAKIEVFYIIINHFTVCDSAAIIVVRGEYSQREMRQEG